MEMMTPMKRFCCHTCIKFFLSRDGLAKHMVTNTHAAARAKLKLPTNREAFVAFALCAKRMGVADDIVYAVGLFMRKSYYEYTISVLSPMRLIPFAKTLSPIAPIKHLANKEFETVILITQHDAERVYLRLTEYFSNVICDDRWCFVRNNITAKVI